MGQQDQGKCSTGMQANLAASLSYLLGFITGIIFYFIEKDNKFVRFHAMQSILLSVAIVVLSIILVVIPIIGPILLSILDVVIFILWIILMVKAYQGENFKLPIIGDIAGKQI